jgi:CHRD domain/PEP-CTERM motif
MKKLTLALIPLVFCVASVSEATVITVYATLTGANEFPPNDSPGKGEAVVTYDSVLHTLSVSATWADLLAGTTVAHIHCCTTIPLDETQNVGVATQTPSFAGFPVGVTSGTYSNTFDLTLDTSWNPNFIIASGGIAAAEARLAQAFEDGTSYLNIHSSLFPAGEIRGFLLPEPGALSILGIGLAAVAAAVRKRR